MSKAHAAINVHISTSLQRISIRHVRSAYRGSDCQWALLSADVASVATQSISPQGIVNTKRCISKRRGERKKTKDGTAFIKNFYILLSGSPLGRLQLTAGFIYYCPLLISFTLFIDIIVTGRHCGRMTDTMRSVAGVTPCLDNSSGDHTRSLCVCRSR